MTTAVQSRKLRIFLCHSSGDKPAVRDLWRRLRSDGFEPWLDEEDLLAGQKWQQEIPKAVRNADVVLVCLSQQSINKQGYVQKEIKFALDVADEKPEGMIYLIPVRLEDCKIPDRLSELQWVNLHGADGYAKLVKALRSGTGISLADTNPVEAPPLSSYILKPTLSQMPLLPRLKPSTRKLGFGEDLDDPWSRYIKSEPSGVPPQGKKPESTPLTFPTRKRALDDIMSRYLKSEPPGVLPPEKKQEAAPDLPSFKPSTRNLGFGDLDDPWFRYIKGEPSDIPPWKKKQEGLQGLGDLDTSALKYKSPFLDPSLIWPDLFPVHGVTLGKTNVAEMAKKGRRTATIDRNTGLPYHCYEIEGMDFWYDKNEIANHIFMTYTDPFPEQWKKLGLDWSKSYDQWMGLLRGMSFLITVESQPHVGHYDHKPSFEAAVKARRIYNPSYEMTLDFKYSQGTSTASPGTLYMFRIITI